jgi:hypothetical protein
MSFENLTDDNIMLYAAKAYDKPNCIISEFSEDMKKLNYLKRLFHRYRKRGEIKERLILNHIVILNNLFGPEATSRLLFFSTSESDYPALKTFLLFLNIMPTRIKGINGKDIISSNILIDMKVSETLRNLK